MGSNPVLIFACLGVIVNLVRLLSIQRSPKASPTQSFLKEVNRDVPFWVIGSATLAIIFFTYVGFSLAINHQANQINTNLEKEIMSLPQTITSVQEGRL